MLHLIFTECSVHFSNFYSFFPVFSTFPCPFSLSSSSVPLTPSGVLHPSPHPSQKSAVSTGIAQQFHRYLEFTRSVQHSYQSLEFIQIPKRFSKKIPKQSAEFHVQFFGKFSIIRTSLGIMEYFLVSSNFRKKFQVSRNLYQIPTLSGTSSRNIDSIHNLSSGGTSFSKKVAVHPVSSKGNHFPHPPTAHHIRSSSNE